MKITVCQLSDDRDRFEEEWPALIEHIQGLGSDLVLLPEMIASSWFASSPDFNAGVWNRAMKEHDSFLSSLTSLSPAIVASTRPTQLGSRRLNEGFLWDGNYRPVHHKYYLPNQEHVWEANWYHRGDGTFSLAEMNDIKMGFTICSDLWFFEHAQRYGREGADMIFVPRASLNTSLEQWLLAGRTGAIISGAFMLSSNRMSNVFGGQGWIIHPSGEVLAMTSAKEPFITLDIDLSDARRAKSRYPNCIPL